MFNREKIRNIAIIAHVDHGKTTLVDGFLKQTHTFRDNEKEMSQDLIMDSMDQERERGITIKAKITTVKYKDYKINIIDTPGHADFGGEVERTLNMADGCLLIVDAQEGPMPQTKFVLKKAFAAGLKPVVVINKIDKPNARVAQVEHELGDLFLELATNDAQLHYPVYYAVAKAGKAWKEMPADFDAEANLEPIFEAIVNEIPTPKVSEGTGLQLLVTALDYDSYKGRYAIGRIQRGSVSPGMPVAILTPDKPLVQGKIEKVFTFEGLGKVEAGEVKAGDIVSVTGLSAAHIGETVSSIDQPEALPTIKLDPPALRMYLGPNTSPFKGLEGSFTTSRQIGERLQKELETNIGLKVEQSDIGFTVSGRGELHLSVLIETMRREGFELEVGRPQVVEIVKDGVTQEPYEELSIEVSPEYVSAVQSELLKRRAKIIEQTSIDPAKDRLVYELSTRATLGLRAHLMTATKGTVIMNALMSGYKPLVESAQQQRGGALVAWEQGVTTAYALQTVEQRGISFLGPGERVYGGQIVGLSSRYEDIDINVAKEKQLTNMRSKSSDGTVQLTPPVRFSLEQNLDFLEDDELLEVTPKSMRLRKRVLDRNKRK